MALKRTSKAGPGMPANDPERKLDTVARERGARRAGWLLDGLRRRDADESPVCRILGRATVPKKLKLAHVERNGVVVEVAR